MIAQNYLVQNQMIHTYRLVLMENDKDTRKMPILGYQYYTKEERKDPRNKKKRHIWIPLFWSSQHNNFQSSILSYFPFLFLVIVIIYRVYF